MAKFINSDDLNKLAKALNNKAKNAVSEESSRAQAAEQALQTSIDGKSTSGHDHNTSYYTKSEINTKVTNLQAEIDADVKAEADRAKGVEAELQVNIDKKSNDGHNHDSRYYTEAEINTKLASKSDTSHTHDDRYYTETEIDAKVTTLQSNIDGKANKTHGNHVPETQTADNAVFLRNDNTWQRVEPDNIGAASIFHGTHVVYSTSAPKAAGTAFVGLADSVARGDHVHPLQESVTGNAGTATKLETARTITIGNKGNTFDGSANITYSLADIGASPLQKSVVSKSKSGTTLTLSVDRYQKATLASGDTIALPSVSNFTEINLFVKDCSLTNVILPDNCKWRVNPNLQTGTSFMFTFIYTTQEWLAEVKIYS